MPQKLFVLLNINNFLKGNKRLLTSSTSVNCNLVTDQNCYVSWQFDPINNSVSFTVRTLVSPGSWLAIGFNSLEKRMVFISIK